MKGRDLLRWSGVALLLLGAACAPAAPSGPPPTAAPAPPPPTAEAAVPVPAVAPPAPTAAAPPAPNGAPVADLPGATTIGLAAAEDGALYAVFGQGQSLYVARSDDGGASFGPPTLASGATSALISPFERPTVAAGPGGQVVVSWLEQQGSQTVVWLARSADGAASFGAPEQVAVSGEFETTMARLVVGPPAPVVAWLQGGGLWLGRAGEAGYQLAEIDGLVCECCQPAALAQGDDLLLAYRDLNRSAAGDLRDIVVVRSGDGGQSFVAPVQASEGHWQINACPIAGPALAAGPGRLYVAWMDGRDIPNYDGTLGDLWVAASDDGGASFGPNVRVNRPASGYHSLPALGVDGAGSLHLAWEASEDGAGSIRYARSDDGGASFGPARDLAAQSPEGGRPRGVAMAVGPGGAVYIAWVDRAGGHVVLAGAS